MASIITSKTVKNYVDKPPLGSTINWGHPLSKGLVGCWLMNEGEATVRDIAYGQTLYKNGTATYGRRGIVSGIQCDANDEGVEAVIRRHLALRFPLTLVWSGVFLGTPGTNAALFGVTANNTDTDPWLNYALAYSSNSGGTIDLFWNNVGVFESLKSSNPLTVTTTKPMHLVGVFNKTLKALYYDTKLNDSKGTSDSYPDRYGATSLIHFGDYTGITRNSNVIHNYGYIYNRALQPA